MPKSLELSSLALSPWTYKRVIDYCRTQDSSDEKWYWVNVKSGMDQIKMHRRVALATAIVISLAQLAPTDQLTSLSITAVTSLLLVYSLGSMYHQASKIHAIVEPYLKITCLGAEPMLKPGATAEKAPAKDYGSTVVSSSV